MPAQNSSFLQKTTFKIRVNGHVKVMILHTCTVIWVVYVCYTTTQGAINDEWRFLRDFYTTTNGDSWVQDNSGWSFLLDNTNYNNNSYNYSTEYPCQIICDSTQDIYVYGITCDCNSYHIIELIFTDTNLNGTLPNSIGNLHYLTTLIIDTEFSLFGSIPQSLYNITTMTKFELLFTNITGNLSSNNNFLKWKDSLEYYIVVYNPNIHDYLYSTHSFWNLKNLKELIFEYNDNIWIELNNNNLCNFNNIEIIVLDSSLHAYGKIPDNCICTSWIHLETLTIGYWYYDEYNIKYNISGNIDSCLANISPNLTELVIVNTYIGGNIFSNSNCTWNNLAFLNIASNRFSGTISTSCMSKIFEAAIRFEQGLISLDLSVNIPTFKIDDNRFGGSLPDTIYVPNETDYIIDDNDNYNGTIAMIDVALDWDWDKCFISYFDLSYNRFYGTLPDYIAQCDYSLFKIHDNKFSGSIPSQLLFGSNEELSSSIYLFELENNEFQTLPDLKNTPNNTVLRYFDVGNNKIIENDIGAWLNKFFISFLRVNYVSLLGNDKLSGDISKWTKAGDDESYEKMIWLHDCDIYGILNENLFGKHLEEISLVNNRISGEIPNRISDFVNITGYALLGNYMYLKDPSKVNWIDRDFISSEELYQTSWNLYYSYGCITFVIIAYVVVILFKFYPKITKMLKNMKRCNCKKTDKPRHRSRKTTLQPYVTFCI